jgi:hypothetical protein
LYSVKHKYSTLIILLPKLYQPGPVVIKKKMMSPAQFDSGCEPLLKREGTFVDRREGTRSPSLNTGGVGVYSMNKTGGRRKVFITRANAAS